MPLGLDGEVAGQASTAVIGTLPSGQRRTAGEGLAQGQDSVIGLARADEEPHGTGPVFASEGDTDQVLGGLVTLGPLPSLVEDRRGGGAADRFRDFGVTVPERSRGVTRVDHLAAVAEPEPHPVAAHPPQIRGLTIPCDRALASTSPEGEMTWLSPSRVPEGLVPHWLH